MKALILVITLIVSLSTKLYAQEANYIFVVPTKGDADFLNAVSSELSTFVGNISSGLVILTNQDGKVACSLQIKKRSQGNYPRLMRQDQCSELEMQMVLAKDSGLPANIPGTLKKVLNNVRVNKGDHVVIFDTLFYVNDKEILDFKTGFPSQGHMSKLAYGISSWSAHGMPKPSGQAYLHIVYPDSDTEKYITTLHETKITEFYSLWSEAVGLQLASFQSITQGLNRVAQPDLIGSQMKYDTDSSMNSVFFTEVGQSIRVPLHKPTADKSGKVKEDLLLSAKDAASLSKGDTTMPQYQFRLAAPAILEELILEEVDGDDNGTNAIRVDLVDVDGTVINIGKLQPSSNDKTKRHVVAVAHGKPIQSVIILPIKADGTADVLGGWWAIRELAVIHK